MTANEKTALQNFFKEVRNDDDLDKVMRLMDHIRAHGDSELFKELADLFDMYCTDKAVMEKLGLCIRASAEV